MNTEDTLRIAIVGHGPVVQAPTEEGFPVI
jgi:hypothetical protein